MLKLKIKPFYEFLSIFLIFTYSLKYELFQLYLMFVMKKKKILHIDEYTVRALRSVKKV